ncbi:hypothetical protein DPMN_079297 [Dreissena polymorpha]|uniref:BRCT domain-containing protein n=1 Tax=Dreissena polymorpha TaxID=45954 RepID=A0A9D3YQH6_DREPO|nr:hypothetical protein DPMN_079297 [Dreissena polymorpha]
MLFAHYSHFHFAYEWERVFLSLELLESIINGILGQKYQFAKKWELSIVRTEWLYDSIERGYCLSPQDYGLEEGGPTGMKTSTPERQSMTGIYRRPVGGGGGGGGGSGV